MDKKYLLHIKLINSYVSNIAMNVELIPKRITKKYLATLTDEQKEFVLEYKKERKKKSKEEKNKKNGLWIK